MIDKGTSANNVHENVFMPEKKRRQREGYGEGDYTLHHTLSAKDFIYGSDAVGLLGTANRITFETEEEKQWEENKEVTSEEVKANCSDLKVLGKGDFKILMKWRTSLRQEVSDSLSSYIGDPEIFFVAWLGKQNKTHRRTHSGREGVRGYGS